MEEAPATFALSVHARWRCASSGACCTAGWPIAVEPAAEERIREALTAGRLALPRPRPLARLLPAVPGLPEGARVLAGTEDGACLFFEADRGRRCALHRQLGEEALPAACRHFPRQCVITPRGVFLTLSHFCPTAAGLLFEPGPLEIVRDPPAFPPARAYEGLDARAGLPLLRPGVLFDWEGYAGWEAHQVATLAREDLDAASALARLALDAERLRTWAPAAGPLADFVEQVAGESRAAGAPAPLAPGPAARWRAVLSAVPAGLTGPNPPGEPLPLADADRQPPLRRYLAARAFASRAALEGAGVRTAIAALAAALAGVQVHAGLGLKEAIRATELVLAHLADPAALARTWSRAERARRTPGT